MLSPGFLADSDKIMMSVVSNFGVSACTTLRRHDIMIQCDSSPLHRMCISFIYLGWWPHPFNVVDARHCVPSVDVGVHDSSLQDFDEFKLFVSFLTSPLTRANMQTCKIASSHMSRIVDYRCSLGQMHVLVLVGAYHNI